MGEHFLPKRGNYRGLIVYQKAECIYDITYYFTSTYLKKGDRTIDQMVQAARSGKQNIVEGQAAMPTSFESALKLTNVAKASLHELRIDYEDYLRTRQLRQWSDADAEFVRLREAGREHNESAYYMGLAEGFNDEQIANLAIILICQTDYLLYRLLQALHAKFLIEGGFREQLSRERREARMKDWNKTK